METDAFDRGLRAFVRRVPFQPFTVELLSGDRFQVLHREALAFNNGVAMYMGIDGVPRIFDNQSVSQMIGMVDAQPNRAT